MRKDFLPFARPSIGPEEIRAAVTALESGWLTRGPRVEEFERAFKSFFGCADTVALSSATAALHLALLAGRIAAPAEVITTPFTFASTANVVLLAGAKLVFADIQEPDLNISTAAVRERLTDNTRAVIAVHFAGNPCDLIGLRKICQEHELLLIEDAAHALGSVYQRERIGAFSDFAAFSFYPIKNITAAEGGMAVTNGKISAAVIRQLSWYGLSEDPWDRARREAGLSSVVLMPGLKCNMTDLQAAIGLAQLQQLERFNAIRAEYARLYRALLQDVEEIILPPEPQDGCKSSWHLFVIRLRLNRLRINREEFCRAMAQRNIGTSYHYKSLHLHPYYRDHFGYEELDFPVAAAASRSVVSVPLYPAMTEADVEAVVDAIKDVLAKALR